MVMNFIKKSRYEDKILNEEAKKNKCLNCKDKIVIFPNIFCGHSCSATYNNTNKKGKYHCKECEKKRNQEFYFVQKIVERQTKLADGKPKLIMD